MGTKVSATEADGKKQKSNKGGLWELNSTLPNNRAKAFGHQLLQLGRFSTPPTNIVHIVRHIADTQRGLFLNFLWAKDLS